MGAVEITITMITRIMDFLILFHNRRHYGRYTLNSLRATITSVDLQHKYAEQAPKVTT